MSKIATPEKISRAMSFVLRHHPESISLAMNSEGWVKIEELAEGLSNQFSQVISIEQIVHVVAVDSKKRYAIAGELIRASQGHSIPVNLGFVSKVPPAILFHGTAIKNLESISISGLLSGTRQFVHLSENIDTATLVGSRHGVPVILEVMTEAARQSGIEFFQSENNVWLVSHIPAKFIQKLN